MKQRFSKRTRLVSMLLALAMVFTFLPMGSITAVAASGNVKIDGTNFPDAKFQEYLKTAMRPGTNKKIDEDGNGILSANERNEVYRIDVRKSGIKDLTGIHWFPNLYTLECSELGLSELNLSENKYLDTLNCSENKLTKLDLSQNTELTDLNCSGNKLTQLNLPVSTKLVKLICYDNQLSALDVNSLSGLTNLSCGKNSLGTLDVSNLTSLQSLACYENGLAVLNVKNNSSLKYLSCGGNQLTKLDLSNNQNLTELYCSDNLLSQLDLRQNKKLVTLQCFQNKLEHLDVSQCTKLQTIQCAENQLTSLDVTKNTVLYELDCAGNQLVELNTQNNVALNKLNCERNRLAGIDLDSNVYLRDYSVGDNVYPVKMKSDRTVDLSKLPGGFDVERASFWYGGKVQGNILTVNEEVTRVRYQYRYRNSLTEYFYLDVSGTVPPVTPPSGGGSTGGGSTGGGSTGGSTGGDGGGGGAVILLAGGAALLGGIGIGVYNYVTNAQLKALLPAGTPVPQTRGETALLLWNTAGRPHPIGTPAFVDVADPDAAKAAQWCVEAGIMDWKSNDQFAPDKSISRSKVLKAYKKLVG